MGPGDRIASRAPRLPGGQDRLHTSPLAPLRVCASGHYCTPLPEHRSGPRKRGSSVPRARPDSVDLLAIAAHPDDAELTCGGTLAKAVRQGYRVGILDLVAGESGTSGSAELRLKEAERAA